MVGIRRHDDTTPRINGDNNAQIVVGGDFRQIANPCIFSVGHIKFAVNSAEREATNIIQFFVNGFEDGQLFQPLFGNREYSVERTKCACFGFNYKINLSYGYLSLIY